MEQQEAIWEVRHIGESRRGTLGITYAIAGVISNVNLLVLMACATVVGDNNTATTANAAAEHR